MQNSADDREERTFPADAAGILNTDALFSDGTKTFVCPMEPEIGEEVTIRFRTAAANAEAVYLCPVNREKLPMTPERSEGVFDYFAVKLRLADEPLAYYFEVHGRDRQVCYTKGGVSEQPDEHFLFRICPGFSTPDWAKGAVMYQIFTDRFCNGDPGNDVLDHEYSYGGGHTHRVADWDRLPEPFDVGNFYGGDLEGVRKKLDYLQELGIEVIYFNPLFLSPSNHKYDTQDYGFIDPHLGRIVADGGQVLKYGDQENTDSERYIRRVTDERNLEASNDLFRLLCGEIHARGMRLILDGVFNHCGSFNRWMDREGIYKESRKGPEGAYLDPDSPWRPYFSFKDENAWPDNDSYEGWWGVDTLPKLNYENSEELTEYILQIGEKWVSPPYNADGWRLDVAADLGFSPEFNHSFWKRFRTVVKEANPDALILAEHYGNCESWLKGDEWDSVMNYDAFMEPLTWFFTGMEKHSDVFIPEQIGNYPNFRDAVRYHMASFMEPSLLTAMNELSNHDHSRFLTRTNHIAARVGQFDYDAASDGVSRPVMREAVIMQMTWPGAPAVYYGDEAGVCGFTDPDNRRTYPWGKEDREMLEFHRQAIRMHRKHPVLRTGSLRMLGGEENCLFYGRFDENEQIITAFNNAQHETAVRIPVWEAGVPVNCEMERIFCSDLTGFTEERERFPVRGGFLTLTLPAVSALVLKSATAGEGSSVSKNKN